MKHKQFTVVFSLLAGVSFQTGNMAQTMMLLERFGIDDQDKEDAQAMMEEEDEIMGGPGVFCQIKTRNGQENMIVFRSQ